MFVSEEFKDALKKLRSRGGVKQEVEMIDLDLDEDNVKESQDKLPGEHKCYGCGRVYKLAEGAYSRLSSRSQSFQDTPETVDVIDLDDGSLLYESSANKAKDSNDSYGVPSFDCTRCGRKYKYKNNLKTHIKVECGKEPSFGCEECHQKFHHFGTLKRHCILVHNKFLSNTYKDKMSHRLWPS
ncbi:unnamed protein product [Bemisia tabaci]|uniref:C2H2-type domain-containing protein n=1 Tax=Bemisia tabaci TaxID=7038 RepID=A0A9P0EYK7_BEMTA|nr:unnamed protein product [Bemisia tabaci]